MRVDHIDKNGFAIWSGGRQIIQIQEHSKLKYAERKEEAAEKTTDR